jgi:hypothetical protein
VVEVDHVRDIDQVKPTGGEVGGDKSGDGARAQTIERALAPALGHVPVHRDRPHLAARELG